MTMMIMTLDDNRIPDWALPIRGYVGERTYVRLSDLLDSNQPWEPQLVYKALAQGYVHVDLLRSDLSTPSNCIVYPDELTKELVELNQSEFTHVRDRSIYDLCIGDTLTWNSAMYVLESIDNNEVVLTAQSGKKLKIPRPRFHEILESEITVIHQNYTDVDKNTVLPPLKNDEQKRRLIEDVTCLRSALERDTPPPEELSRLRKLFYKAKARGGVSCNLVALVAPKDHLKGNYDDKAPNAAMERAVLTLRTYRLADPPEDVTECWNRYVSESEDNYLPAISRTTFFALDSSVSIEDKIEALRGQKGAYQVKPRTGARQKFAVLESKGAWHVASLDSTTPDVMFFDEETGFIYKSGPLVRLTDVYSRMPLAITASLIGPSSLTTLALLQACIARHGTLPLVIVVDQGSEFDNIDFEVALAAYGVTLVRRRASFGRDGSILERQNEDFDQRFIDSLRGNTRQLKNPRGLDPTKNPESLAIWTPRAFAEEAAHYCFDVYPRLNNEGIHATPFEKYQYSHDTLGLASKRIITLDEQTHVGLLPATTPRQLTANPRTGCRYKRIPYWHPCYREPKIAMRKFDAHRVPYDISHLWMFINKHWIKCLSDRHAELLGMTEIEAQLISQMHYEDSRRTASRRHCNSLILANNRERVREREDNLKAIRAAEISRTLMFGVFAPTSCTNSTSATVTPRSELLARARAQRRALKDVDV